MRRLKTQTANLEKENAKKRSVEIRNRSFERKLIGLNKKQIGKTCENKNKTEQLRYHRLKRSKDQVTADKDNKFL